MKDEDKTPEFDTLGFHLGRAFTALTGALNRALQESGLPINHSHFVILQMLSRCDGISQNEISRLLGKDAAAVSRSLKFLEDNGFVVKKAVSGCKNGVYVTPKTIRLRPVIEDAIAVATAKGCAGMSEAEYRAGIRFLTRIYESINKSEITPRNEGAGPSR